MSTFTLSFRLPDDFVDTYVEREVPWGFPDAGGNSIGEVTFLRSYSRLKEDGTKEHWHEVCRRVVEGVQSILKDHCLANRLPWNDNKAHASAREMYERMFMMKWLPPGRGLWMMGTDYVHGRGNSAALQNCAFVSTGDMTKRNPEKPFTFLMEASMLGIGVGFDTAGAQRGIVINKPEGEAEVYVVEDSREGWVEAMSRKVRSYLVPGQAPVVCDVTQVRPAGAAIKGFGGTAAGPGPLVDLLGRIDDQFKGREGQTLGSRDIVDISNHIGVCVVAGNVRRSAEIALGDADDKDFLNLKNYDLNPERAEYGWVSNNTVKVDVGANYEPYIDRIVSNGEPGFLYLGLAQMFGRLADPANGKDYRAEGVNPCGEQTLESYECCTLVETFPTNCTDMADYHRTLKFAYMYAKAVTLVPTHWPETNAVMQRNRRIGCSASGLWQFAEQHGRTELRRWLNDGYAVIQGWDSLYSEWLGIRESIKTTSIKPSGSVSLVAGVTPGVHAPTEDTYIRRMRLGTDDPLTWKYLDAGYRVEPAYGNEKTTVVVEIPVRGFGIRTEKEATIFEKTDLAALAQEVWADNQVSFTGTFDPTVEGKHIGPVLRMFEGRLKSLSFLPIDPTAYPQMPYEGITLEQYDAYTGLKKIDFGPLYEGGADAEGELYCTTDKCEVPLTLPGGERIRTGGERNEPLA